MGESAMYKRILLAYNGTHEGRIALFECAEIASFVKAETHLLAVATPSMSMYVEGFEGNVSEQGMARSQRLMKNVLAEGLATLTQRGYSVTGHVAVGEPWSRSAGSQPSSSATSSSSATRNIRGWDVGGAARSAATWQTMRRAAFSSR
jgi:hypothetical protein